MASKYFENFYHDKCLEQAFLVIITRELFCVSLRNHHSKVNAQSVNFCEFNKYARESQCIILDGNDAFGEFRKLISFHVMYKMYMWIEIMGIKPWIISLSYIVCSRILFIPRTANNEQLHIAGKNYLSRRRVFSMENSRYWLKSNVYCDVHLHQIYLNIETRVEKRRKKKTIHNAWSTWLLPFANVYYMFLGEKIPTAD